MDQYDPLADIIHVAELACEDQGQISKAVTLKNLQLVLREDIELSKELQRRMAQRLKNVEVQHPE
jgi:hypothetical protein